MSKQDTQANITLITRNDSNVVASNSIDSDDKFSRFYTSSDSHNGPLALRPPIEPKILQSIALRNDSLPPCVAAMELNIDGTGYDIIEVGVSDTDEGKESKQLASMKWTFENCFPSTNFLTTRKKIRVDQEQVGYAYMEVIRSSSGKIAYFKHQECQDMRLIALDEPTIVSKKTMSMGSEVTVNFKVRERRFMQLVGDTTVYFKEFGASRDLNKNTGEWAERNKRLPAENRATEIIFFKNQEDPESAYGLPRWFHNSPSVVGGRKAEELNLEFFNTGGIPPIFIAISGGAFSEESKDLLQNLFNGEAQNKTGAAILEAYSTDGSLNSSSKVSIDVHKFGAEVQRDSMFEGYIDTCERRVRRSFRLPPMFVGKTEDYSYATAFVSYTVAEEQVFSPERLEFDNLINNTLLMDESFGAGKFCLKSKPLTVKDIETRVKLLEIASNKNAISNQELVSQINDMIDTNLEWNGQNPLSAQEILDSMNANQEDSEETEEVSKSESFFKSPLELIEFSSLISRALLDKATPDEYKKADKLLKSLNKNDLSAVQIQVSKDILQGYDDGGAINLIYNDEKGCC